MQRKNNRHTPAFLLLFLAEAPSYGAQLLGRMESELPYCFSDSAIVYRSLQEMERDGLVNTTWHPAETGQPRKWYAITEQGRKMLGEYALDIERRRANLDFFISRYTGPVDRQ